MNRQFPLVPLLVLTFSTSACGPAAGTQPHDMSVADHQAAAAAEDRAGTEHAVQHDPNATQTETSCTGERGRVCWSETKNPTAPHADVAAEHRDLASKHRAASQALKDAETSTCAGLSEEDRDTSPFAHRSDIQSVSQFHDEQMVGKNKVSREAGATIVFRATPGLTAEWLQRIVDCHVARNAAVGHDMPEMAYCPLVPRSAEARVRSVGDGFAVDVWSDNAESAAEIWQRAQQLTAAR